MQFFIFAEAANASCRGFGELLFWYGLTLMKKILVDGHSEVSC